MVTTAEELRSAGWRAAVNGMSGATDRAMATQNPISGALLTKHSWKGVALGKTVETILNKESNNFDLLRFLAATSVIYGHCFAVSPAPGQMDLAQRLLHFDYTGGIAVTIFFFLSGLLIFQSVVHTPSTARYLLSRVARIFPGLAVCLFLSVMVVGPMFTTLDIKSYFLTADTHTYFLRNLCLTDLQWRLAGVFDRSQFGLNGSLWTLPCEIRLYLTLGALGMFGVFRTNSRGNAVLIGVFLAGWFFPSKIPYFLKNPDITPAVVAFLTGCLFSLNKQWLRVGPLLLLLVWVPCCWFWGTTPSIWLFYLGCFCVCLWLFSLDAIVRLKLPGDYSYGIYIYGFVVQQCVASLQLKPDPIQNLLLSIPIAIALGALSWHFVEKPVMGFVKEWGMPRSLIGAGGGTRRMTSYAIVAMITLMLLMPLLPVSKGIVYLSDVRILAFGPTRVFVGQQFNVQPNGVSAIWVTASRRLSPQARLVLGGETLTSHPNGTTITAAVPEHLLRTPGAIALWIEEPVNTGVAMSSADKSLEIFAKQ